MGQALVYITLAVCMAGCILRIFLAGYYRLLLKSLKSMKTSKSKWVKQVKEQFILRYQAMLGVQNVESFVDRFLAEQRLLGFPLSAWKGIHIQLTCICLLGGTVVALYLCIQMAPTKEVLLAMFQGLWTSAFLLLVDGFCMISSKAENVRCDLCDYLENYLQVRLEHDYEVWGKNREELRQTKAVLDAQLQVIDEKAYRRQKKLARIQDKKLAKQTRAAEKKKYVAVTKELAATKQSRKTKRRPEAEQKIRRDVAILKQEVQERRKRDAEAMALAAAMEMEKSTSRQVEEILQGLV